MLFNFQARYGKRPTVARLTETFAEGVQKRVKTN